MQVRSLAQLQGKKFRVAGAIEGEALKSLGAVPVGMPPTEVPESVSRGTIDGSTSHPAPLFDFGIVRVTRYHYFMPLGVVPLTILMNRKKFDSLPPKAQEIIRKYSGDWTRDRFISGISAYNEALLDKLRSDPQHTVTTPTAAEVAEARTKFDTVTASWADRSARNAELLKLVRAEIEKVRKGQ